MDLGTDYRLAGVSLWLCSGHSHKVLDGCLEVVVAWEFSCLLARWMPSERRGERILIQASDNTCQI